LPWFFQKRQSQFCFHSSNLMIYVKTIKCDDQYVFLRRFCKTSDLSYVVFNLLKVCHWAGRLLPPHPSAGADGTNEPALAPPPAQAPAQAGEVWQTLRALLFPSFILGWERKCHFFSKNLNTINISPLVASLFRLTAHSSQSEIFPPSVVVLPQKTTTQPNTTQT